MLVVWIRLVFIYLFTLLTTRTMGKRQIGQMEVSELVSTFFLSELATFYVTDRNVSLLHAVTSMGGVITLEIVISYLSLKLPWVKRAVDDAPSFLIYKGRIMQKEMEKNRVTLGELVGQIRQHGIGDLGQVNYCVLEANGQFSVIPKDANQALTPQNMNLTPPAVGLSHALIADGCTDPKTLQRVGWNEKKLRDTLKKQGYRSPKQVFLMTVDDLQNVVIVPKEKA